MSPGKNYGATILLVDDTPTNLHLLTQLLSRAGYRVRAVNSGQRALEAAQASPPDLIMLDVMMPEMDGYETCRRLKTSPDLQDIPVIFISALDTVEDKVRAFETGGVDYVTKPFEEAEIMARVKTHLILRQMQQRLQAQNEQLQQEVTERRRAEEALRWLNVELTAQNAELSAFARTVAHDLKNPLTALTGIAEILSTDYASLSSEELGLYLRRVAWSGRKAGQIVEALLVLAGVRQHQVEPESIDMAAILAETRRRLAGMIAEYQAEIRLPATWPVAWGYAPWIEEVWVNYLSNGIKYGGRPPCLELGAAVSDDRTAIRFWVRDNGSGLAPEAQARLFTEFTRLEPGRAEGHGLGLAIVRRIIEKLGGQVGVESTPGQGSTFSFTLPAFSPAANGSLCL